MAGRLNFDFGVAGADPIDELVGAGHGGEATLADKGEVGEEVGGLDGAQGGGRIESAEESKIDDGGFRIFGVGVGSGSVA